MDRNFWEDMRRMRKGMNQYFSYPDFSEDEDEIDEPSDYRKAWAEFSETENSFVMNIEIPGVNKEDIKVNLTSNAVEIRADKKTEKKEESEGVINYARGYAGFYRMISLPARADVESIRDIRAIYKNGILKLEIPKKKTAKKDKKEIIIECFLF